jgi:hypothetical protein
MTGPHHHAQFFFFWQGLMLARQVPHHLSHSASPQLFIGQDGGGGGLLNFLLMLVLNFDLPE